MAEDKSLLKKNVERTKNEKVKSDAARALTGFTGSRRSGKKRRRSRKRSR